MSSSPNQNGFTLFVEVPVRPERIDEFLSHYKTMLQQIQLEEGFQSLEVFRSAEDPNRLCWVENWGCSKDWFFENVYTRPYVQQYIQATEQCIAGERSVRAWNRLGGDFAIAQPGIFRAPTA